MPRLARIVVYPIRSLDGVEVDESPFVAGGGLAHDRRFALRDEAGKIVNGKRFPTIHHISAEYDLTAGTVRLRTPERTAAEFRLAASDADLERWFTDYFGFQVTVDENRETGFPDDLDSPGPTVIGASSLSAVAGWFPPLKLAEVRRRFRANLEIDASSGEPSPPAPFWEDRLFADDAAPDALSTVEFRIGAVRFEGVNPCARCAVPTRDSHTGDVWPRFAQEFQTRRADSLPAWAPLTAFDHFYRLSVNTRVPPSETGKRIRVGDSLVV